jgi:hypothetical protein
MEDKIKSEILVPEEPQIMGALGAAMHAKAELGKVNKTSKHSSRVTTCHSALTNGSHERRLAEDANILNDPFGS